MTGLGRRTRCSHEKNRKKLSDSVKTDRKQKQNKEQTDRRSIIQMLQRFRATSDSDVSGCNPDIDSSGDEM